MFDLFLFGSLIPIFATVHVLSWLVLPYTSKAFNTVKGSDKGYWVANYVSTFHAIGAVILSANCFMDRPEMLTEDDFFMTSDKSHFMGHFFMAYIFFDLLVCLYYNTRFPAFWENMVHHGCVLLCWYQLVGGDENHDSE